MIEFELLDFYLVTEDYSNNIEYTQEGVWNGPNTPEVIEKRKDGLRRAWDKPGRREAASAAMKAARPTMPYATSLTHEHRMNISKGLQGNQNARKKK